MSQRPPANVPARAFAGHARGGDSPHYVIVYRIAKDSVVILAVLHVRQEYP
ncbi:type II toxin-antitoxin system RelE/ParE family toxin [Sphingomonas sp. PB4P5]|uniref:type II toxin-antitoxin system RelE/ParE family toxin n=1 Tax=Parasphingomonas puruogangriensis TaxID=3096155 RepID=UPI003FA7D2A6